MLPWSGRLGRAPRRPRRRDLLRPGDDRAPSSCSAAACAPAATGTDLGILLAFAWAACPYTAFALESNTNDALVAFLLVATLLVLTSPPARGAMLALASATKFAPLALAPLFATYDAARARVARRARTRGLRTAGCGAPP